MARIGTERTAGSDGSTPRQIYASYEARIGTPISQIPLYLTNCDIADIALALCKNDSNTAYIGHTCLTLFMAYNNARLIAKPDASWLVDFARAKNMQKKMIQRGEKSVL